MKTHIPMWRNSKTSVPPPNFKIFLRKLSTLDFFRSLFMIELWSGWIPTLLDLLHSGKNYWSNSTASFFSMSRVNEARKEISSFTQDEDEKFSECLARFKDLLIKCPPLGYEKWRLVQFFYQGLSQPNRSMIKLMNGGAFLNLTWALAYKALDKLADNSQ